MNNPLDPFHFDPTYNPGTSTPNVQIESLTLPDLMKNPHVLTMYNNWKDASTQVVQAAQMQQILWKENTQLHAEVSSLQEKHQQVL
jgi:hypothetical protein